jgi:hypothetical protein
MSSSVKMWARYGSPMGSTFKRQLCYNPRPIRGYEKQWRKYENSTSPQAGARYLSTHAWALAIDVNAFENGLGKKPKLSAAFVKCFTDAGFVWGGTFARLDGMHFELKT